ncbi:MAG: SRPBCC family protein [Woeseiaceae bacterium]|nr:SRPBCC family protein [Woeseiaceae bacterium]
MKPKTVGKLIVTTPTALTIRIEREFDAPRELLFDAHTRADLVKRWLLGPGDWSMPECEIDLRVGGEYRYLWRHPAKGDMGLNGKFVDIDPPAKLVTTERFDDEWYPGECTNTIEFKSVAGKTRMVLTMKYQSEEARNVALKSPMDEGIEAGYERLDVLLMPA